MAPTIRIDDEVYRWLQEHARPFEDTPNTVLRRIAGLESSEIKVSQQTNNAAELPGEQRKLPKSQSRRSSTPRRPVQVTGQQLNQEWQVGALQALFHRDGCWYNNLIRFPGALFDRNGYVLFATEEEYRNCSFLKIGKQTNVLKDISSIPSYVRKK